MLKLSWPASSLLLYQHDALDRISTLAISGSALVQRFYDDQYLRTETRAMRGTSYFRQGNQVLALHETSAAIVGASPRTACKWPACPRCISSAGTP